MMRARELSFGSLRDPLLARETAGSHRPPYLKNAPERARGRKLGSGNRGAGPLALTHSARDVLTSGVYITSTFLLLGS